MIRVESLSKQYGPVRALDGLSLTVQRGEIVALVGPNGSGKSTALRSLAGLTLPGRGRLLIDDIDVRAEPKKARSLLAFLPQRVAFAMNLTAREMLQFQARLRCLPWERVLEVLEETGFELEPVLDQRIGQLSGGTVQRLGLLAAFLPEVPYFILDEPTLSLDLEGVFRLATFMKSVRKLGKSILFASHIFSDVKELADRSIVLVEGRRVATLEAKESLSLEELYLAQLGGKNQ